MQLPPWHNTYLVLTAEDIPQDVGPAIQGIVHIPGMCCHACKAHLDTAFIQIDGSYPRFFGKECTSSVEADAWYAVMKRARHYIAYEHFKVEQRLKRSELTAFRALALICQLHPYFKDYAGMFQEVMARGEFSAGILERVQAMTTQLGGLDTLLKHRDQLRRLHLLQKIIQERFIHFENANTVASLLFQGRNEILTEKQNRLIHALLDKYSQEIDILAERLLYLWKGQRKKLEL